MGNKHFWDSVYIDVQAPAGQPQVTVISQQQQQQPMQPVVMAPPPTGHPPAYPRT